MLGQKGGLPRNIVINPKNDTRVIEIITRSGRNLSDNVGEVDEKYLEEKSSAKISGKKKQMMVSKRLMK